MTERTEHEERYFEFLKKDGTERIDTEKQALLYILASFGIYDKVDYIYDFKKHEIKNTIFSKTYLSSTAKRMLHLGLNLYNGADSPSPVEIFEGLDNEQLKICLKAISIRFSQLYTLK